MSATQKLETAIKIFFSYAHEDEGYRNRIEKYLAPLKLMGLISEWHDRKILAGEEWADQIDAHLNTAHVILLLVSPDFLASPYCTSVEMARAMERHEAGEAYVIPVILSSIDWTGAPFGKLQALPKDGKPLRDWARRDKAYNDVSLGIRKAVEELAAKQAAEWATKAEEAARRAEAEEAERAKIEEAAKRAEMETELIVKLAEVELAKKRAAELAEQSKQAEEVAKKAEEELARKRTEAEKAAKEAVEAKRVADAEPSTAEDKTLWDILWELLEERYDPPVLEVIENSAQRTLALGQDFIDSMVLFESIIQSSAVADALKGRDVRVEKLVAAFARLNERRRSSTSAISSKEEMGLSKNVLEILGYALHLAHRSDREKASDIDMLEAFVLHRKSSVVQSLTKKLGVEPELLLGGAFRENGELKEERFATTTKAILNDILQRTEDALEVYSRHILAALIDVEDSLARKRLRKLGYDPDRYVRRLLDGIRKYKGRPALSGLAVSVCSANARRILNLAELLARSDERLVHEEHLEQAYFQCMGK